MVIQWGYTRLAYYLMVLVVAALVNGTPFGVLIALTVAFLFEDRVKALIVTLPARTPAAAKPTAAKPAKATAGQGEPKPKSPVKPKTTTKKKTA